MTSLYVDRESGIPPSRQIAQNLQSMIDRGEMKPGDRLPSLRETATAAGVTLNTVRAAHAILERSGAAVTEQGRGTFVASAATPGVTTLRRSLQVEIANLEAELVRLPAVPPAGEATPAPRAAPTPRLLSIEELTAVRDALAERVWTLREARDAITRQIHADRRSPIRAPARNSSSSRTDAQIRWT